MRIVVSDRRLMTGADMGVRLPGEGIGPLLIGGVSWTEKVNLGLCHRPRAALTPQLSIAFKVIDGRGDDHQDDHRSDHPNDHHEWP